jgi:outer membrane protein assembly factor BamD (BamD/ComL family)
MISSFSFAREDKTLYSQAKRAARRGSMDFAYMYYRNLLMRYPNSPFRVHALFAKGEYHFLLPDYRQAQKAFNAYLKEYPDAKGTLFAFAYLFKIADITDNKREKRKIQKQIIDKEQVSLIFRDYEKYIFISPLNKKYEAIFHIDRVEFYAEGEIFTSIPY